MKYIVGKKVGMTQIFNDSGKVQPVTVVQAGPCTITQILVKEKNGYSGVQIGFGSKKLNKPQQGHLKNFLKKNSSFSILREFPFPEGKEEKDVKVGDAITVEQFEKGEKVNVSGTTKSKGFQGVVKRWNFAGGPASHGQKHSLRAPGSIGSAYPQHVLKGKKMAGRMGGVKHTTRNLRVVDIMPKDNILLIKGAIPGHNGTTITITTE
ncbi:MAG: 50S ribosomal protein L3 [Candidatus Spechtbacteria bacterium SB0662_bin_43]|uniref:Large ribosomal subunit protein uL3 n=1 Tax=Candidatus Spechtbacteria bacterium SB0662_bin_43 TaxID=2604897 RepID=A0A845DAI3_9BACT|nr:50S ribosomal protein L3 [Candidatus Spechtbacteria bacterium SB0662_bin_43]